MEQCWQKTNRRLIVALLIFLFGSHGSEAQPRRIAAADSSAIIGYDPITFPPDTQINLRHKDVFATWFVAPTSCSLDTVFWMIGDSIGALDSIVYMKIHRSNITRQVCIPG